MDQYDIVFPISAETIFVESMVAHIFNNMCNQILRWGMWWVRKLCGMRDCQLKSRKRAPMKKIYNG